MQCLLYGSAQMLKLACRLLGHLLHDDASMGLIPEAGHIIMCFTIQGDDCRFRAENTGKAKELS